MVQGFGEKIKILRKSKNITQMQFSAILNIDRSNIAHYESGKRFPPIETIIKIAEFFSVSVDSLVRIGNHCKINKEESDVEKMELRAEIVQLMEVNLKLTQLVTNLEKELGLLRRYNKQLRLHNQFLEKSLKKIP
jgi:transcriptional regulator with XRE-family HTH domain